MNRRPNSHNEGGGIGNKDAERCIRTCVGSGEFSIISLHPNVPDPTIGDKDEAAMRGQKI